MPAYPLIITKYLSICFTEQVFIMSRVTIMKDKDTRKSKGVAFILFLERDSAHKAVRALNRTQVFYPKLTSN